MPAIAVPLIMAGGSALSAWLSSRNKNKQTQTQTNTTTPSMDPAYGPLQQMLIQQAMSRLQNPTGLPANYESGGVNAINKTFDLAGQGMQNNLTSRGLGASPAGVGATERLTAGRAGAIGQFRAGVPLAARELQDKDQGLASMLLNFGRGSTSTGTGAGTQQQGGGAAASSEMLNMLAYLYGSGAFGKKP